tara:strand:+ start:3216 stop:3902 length:687 start_codon:yes stop_codon:yes gene_type:complete
MIDTLNQKSSNPTDSLDLIQEKTLSIIELITSGGTGGNIIMIVLGILSVFTIYILIERIFSLKNANKESEDFLEEIHTLIKEKKYNEAIIACKEENSNISRMIEKGIKRIDKSFNEIHSAMENQGKIEVNKLEHNLTNLATISGAAPMIGFLGTVIGMILAFHDMASAGGNIDVEMLSKGIYTAMITTVAGLTVGIISYISYNFLLSKIDKIIFSMENASSEFLDNIE